MTWCMLQWLATMWRLCWDLTLYQHICATLGRQLVPYNVTPFTILQVPNNFKRCRAQVAFLRYWRHLNQLRIGGLHFVVALGCRVCNCLLCMSLASVTCCLCYILMQNYIVFNIKSLHCVSISKNDLARLTCYYKCSSLQKHVVHQYTHTPILIYCYTYYISLYFVMCPKRAPSTLLAQVISLVGWPKLVKFFFFQDCFLRDSSATCLVPRASRLVFSKTKPVRSANNCCLLQCSPAGQATTCSKPKRLLSPCFRYTLQISPLVVACQKVRTC